MIRIHWGAAVVVGYTAFALATVGFVAFAMTRDVELVSDQYYADALAHDRHMRATANGDAVRADVVTRVEPGLVGLRLPAAMSARAQGTVTLYRASDARADRVMPLQLAADGTQRVPTVGLPSGHWLLKLAWTVGDEPYYVERHLRLP